MPNRGRRAQGQGARFTYRIQAWVEVPTGRALDRWANQENVSISSIIATVVTRAVIAREEAERGRTSTQSKRSVGASRLDRLPA